MINRIYFDIDESLIFTTMRDPKQEHIVLDLDDAIYYTIVRPCAKTLIDFARDLVGDDRVHILTTATRDYAQEVNRLANWGFKNEDIFSREDINSHFRSFSAAYGGYHTECDPHIYAHKGNVIIDNLRPRENERKIAFIGINSNYETNYLRINDYYGVEYADSNFEREVKDFLIERNKDKI